MASYLVVKGNNQTKSFNIKTTHNSTPYLKVNSTGYLDLTTNTGTGIKLKAKVGNNTYRVVNTVTTTASRSSEYTETTGYSGIRGSTSGYSGVSSSQSNYTVTSANAGNLSSTTALTRSSTSGYSGRSSWSGYSSKWNNSAGMYSTTDKGAKYSGSWATVNFVGMATSGSYYPPWQISGTWSVTLTAYGSTVVQSMNYTSDASVSRIDRTYLSTFTGNFDIFTTKPQLTWLGTFQKTDLAITKRCSTLYSGRTSASKYSSNANGAGLYSTTALTRSSTSGYKGYTSSQVTYYSSSISKTNLSSTTALTTTSATTSSVPGTLSSTTALTATSSRSSQYDTITED